MKNEESSNEAVCYDDFEPYCKWKHEPSVSELEILLPGFKKEELKCETKGGFLHISGEHPQGRCITKRFNKKIDVNSKYDIKEIEAKFEDGGVLRVKLPRKSSVFCFCTFGTDKQSVAIIRFGKKLYMKMFSFAIAVVVLVLLAFYMYKYSECTNFRNLFK